jgi:hypothetical protein
VGLIPATGGFENHTGFGIEFANSRAAVFEEPLSLFSEASPPMRNAAKPVGE